MGQTEDHWLPCGKRRDDNNAQGQKNQRILLRSERWYETPEKRDLLPLENHRSGIASGYSPRTIAMGD